MTILKKWKIGTLTAVIAAAVVAMAQFPTQTVAQEIRIKVGHNSPPSYIYHPAFEEFARLMDESTDGRVKVDIFPSAQLGDEQQMIEGGRLGTIEMFVVATAPLSQFVPEVDVLNLPYLFEGYEDAYCTIDGPVGQEFAQLIEDKTGLKVLGWFNTGIRNVYSKEGPVTTPLDMDGLKIRTMQSPTELATFKSFGAAPTPMAFGEVYSSLQTGVIAAAENDPISYLSSKHFEIATYYSLTAHSNSAYNRPVLIGASFFDGLPKDIQDKMVDAMKKTVAFERSEYERRAEEALKTLEANGVTITEVDKAPFRDKAKVVWDQTVERIGPKGKELLEKLLAARNKC